MDTTTWIGLNVIDPIEKSLASVGLNSAFKVGVATAVVAAGVYWTVKPKSAFDQGSGEARPWALIDQLEDNKGGPEPTMIPWWLGSVLLGYGVNLII